MTKNWALFSGTVAVDGDPQDALGRRASNADDVVERSQRGIEGKLSARNAGTASRDGDQYGRLRRSSVDQGRGGAGREARSAGLLVIVGERDQPRIRQGPPD